MKTDGPSEGSETDIAVVGMSGRFAGSADVDELWKHVAAGDDCLTDLDRDELIADGVPASVVDDPAYVRRTGSLDDVAGFDHQFFGIGARDAAVMDPQHRHFLECSWEALESAAIVPGRFDGAVGVFGGCGMNTYLINNLITNGTIIDQLGWFLVRHTANDKDFLTNNVSYRLDLRGPAINVQTACSTSLVAVHLAVQSLLEFESDVALAGGVTIEVPHRVGYQFHEGEILSPDGTCRAYDIDSAGTVLTSGVAVVVLRRLADALEDGDPVLAVIKATAVNNDGSRKVSFLAPSVDAHADVIREALTVCGLSPTDLQMFEGHGTGTAVGDPIEVAAASAAFRTWTDERGFCRLTSTKPNIGHTDTAAGAASLIKVVQAMRHQTLPPLANHGAPSPLLGIENTPFIVSGTAAPWPGDVPRRAGISSLGVGGTNAHVIVEEAPTREPEPAGDPEQILVLSAEQPGALDSNARRLADHLEQHPDTDLRQVAHTLVAGRRAMPYRRVVTATDVATAIRALRGEDRLRSAESATPDGDPRLGLMFPGGGSQYPGMAAGLDARFEAFHAVRAEGIDLVRRAGGVNLEDLLDPSADPAVLRPPTASLPAIFVTSVALARQWMAFGARPDLLLGHSLGEYVAAHLAGVMTFEDAVRLVVVRSALMERASGDDAAMLVVPLSEADVTEMLPATLSLAVVNANDECVVAGRRGPIQELAAALEERGTQGSLIPLAAAAHSAMLDPVLDEFGDAVRDVQLHAPDIPYLSNLSGTWITTEQATDPQYWVDHLRGTVRFAECVRTAAAGTPLILTELGPGQALSSLARRSDPAPHDAIPSLRHPNHDIADTAYTLNAFARQWAAGAPIDMTPLTHSPAPRLRLPTYSFQHERCWIEPGTPVVHEATTADTSSATATPERINDLDDATWAIEWTEIDGPNATTTTGNWLVLGDHDHLVRALATELADRGASVTTRATVGSIDSADDLTGVVMVAPAAADGHEQAAHRWFSDGSDAIKALGGTSHRTRFVAVTRGALPVDGVAERPSDAMALGIALVAAREYPTLATRVVDVDDRTDISALVDDVLCEGPSVVAHRGGSRLASDVTRRRVDRPDGTSPTFRAGGTYLVTGGLGGIGHVLAKHLATEYRAELVIVSSVELPAGGQRERWLEVHSYDDPTSRRIRRLAELEQLGVGVTVVAADMSDPASLRRALDDVEREVGKIDGAIHAAGIVRDVLIELATFGDHAAVLGAKAHGAIVLAEELAERGADLLLLLSSTSTLLAPAGQASYAGANAVLDALSGQRGGLRVATLNFGLWAGVGIASDMARRVRLEITNTEPIVHPFFSERHVMSDRSTALIGRIDDTSSWVVDEHRTVDGTAVYPGAGHVQLMLSAAQALGQTDIALTDVALLTPLIVPSASAVSIRVVVSPDGLVEIYSDDGQGVQWDLRSQGTIVPSVHAVPAPDLRAEMSAMDDLVPDLLGSQRGHMNFGPRWDSVLESKRSDGVVITRLKLDASDAEAGRWSPHPALLDLATAAGVRLVDRSDEPGLFVPTGYGHVQVARPVPQEIIVRATEAETVVDGRFGVDLVAVDRDGEPVFEIKQLELLRSPGHALLEPARADIVHPPHASLADLADELGVRPSEGTELVERLIASDHDRLIGSTIAIADLLARIESDDIDPSADGDNAATGADSLEAAIAAIWSDLLGQADIGPDDDFFDLGGHSLIAIRLMARIHNEVGVRLQLAAIFEAPTIAQLSAHVRSEDPDVDARFDGATATPTKQSAGHAAERSARPSRRLLMPISTSGSSTPLYVVHGAGGNVLFLGSFGRALTERPVFGFQAHGVNADEIPDDSVETMARRYLAELRSHEPGPYLLGGYSGGGAVALEMARTLQSEGQQVLGVVLFDSPVGHISLGRAVHAKHLLRNLVTRGPAPVLPIITSRLQATELGRRWLFRGRTSVHEESHEANYADMTAHGFNDLYTHFTQVSEEFEVGVYDVDAILVKAQLRWPLMSDDYGWSDHITGNLDVIIANGDHESMFQADNAASLAADLAPLLERLARPAAI